MWQTEGSVELAAPVEQVYEYLADLRSHKEWSLGVAKIEQTKGDGVHEGAEFRAEERIPVKFTSFSRITRLEPPGRIDWRSWDGKTFEVDWTFELTAKGNLTHVVQRACFRPQNVLGRLLLLTIRKRQVPKENARSLQRLRELLEAAVGAKE